MRKRKLGITFNSPVVLCYVIICFIVLILSGMTDGRLNEQFFSVYSSDLSDPLTYVRLVGHIFGHTNWKHYMGNMTMLLLIGPLLEEKYQAWFMILVMLVTAVVTGVIHMIFFGNTMLLGASGVVYAFIILSSLTGQNKGSIPLTFILVVAIYIGGQVYDGLFVESNVSNLTHIIGGVVGGLFGLILA